MAIATPLMMTTGPLQAMIDAGVAECCRAGYSTTTNKVNNGTMTLYAADYSQQSELTAS